MEFRLHDILALDCQLYTLVGSDADIGPAG